MYVLSRLFRSQQKQRPWHYYCVAVRQGAEYTCQPHCECVQGAKALTVQNVLPRTFRVFVIAQELSHNENVPSPQTTTCTAMETRA